MIKVKRLRLLVAALAFLVGIAALALVFNLRAGTSASALEIPKGGTPYGIEYIPIEKVEALAKDNKIVLEPGESLKLTVKLTPYYAVETAQKIVYRIKDGNQFAEIEGDMLTAKNDIKAGGSVFIEAEVDKVKSKLLEIQVHKDPDQNTFVPVDSIEIFKNPNCLFEDDYLAYLFKDNYLVEDKTYNLKEILNEHIYPLNSTIKYISRYEITEGSNYVNFITPWEIKVNKLTAVNLSVKIRAIGYGEVISNEVELDLYVPAKKISFDSDIKNLSRPKLSVPVSSNDSGDLVSICANVEGISTRNQLTFEVTKGWDLLYDYYQEGNKFFFQVNPKLTSYKDLNKAITIAAKQDGKTIEKTINVYIPVETVEGINGVDKDKSGAFYIERGGSINFDIITNAHADLTSESNPVWELVNEKDSANFKLDGQTLSLKSTAHAAGKKLVLAFKATENKIEKTLYINFVVTPLKFVDPDNITPAEQFSKDGEIINVSADFKLIYTNTDGTKFSSDRRQLETNTSTNIQILYKGKDLSAYGIKTYKLVISSGEANEITSGLSAGYVGLKINSNASGNGTVSYYIIVTEDNGTEYKIYPYQEIDAFRRYTSPYIYLSDTYITTAETQLMGRIIINSNCSKVSEIQFKALTDSSYSLIPSGLFKITKDTTSYYPTISITAKQYYNDQTIPIGISFNLSLKNITLNTNGDNITNSGATSILAIDGFGKTITNLPTRKGYYLRGYYTNDGKYASYEYQLGTKYYNDAGALLTTHSLNSSITTLYAIWDVNDYLNAYACYIETVENNITYYDKLQKLGDGYKPGSTSTTIEAPATITKAGISGVYEFKEWRIHTGDPNYTTASNLGVFYNESLPNNPTRPYYIGTYVQNPTTNNPLVLNPSNSTVRQQYYIAIYTYNDGGGCVAEGTLITLADGSQKPVEQLNGNEFLLVWNHLTGAFDIAPIIFIDRNPLKEYKIIHLKFSDGTEVKVSFEHAFWDFDLNRYVFIRDGEAEQYIGHWFNKQTTDTDGNMTWARVQLINVETYLEYITIYSPVTYGHLNFYVNGLLSMPGDTTGLINLFEIDADTLQYNQDAFLADIEMYGLFEYIDFADMIPEEIFEAFQVQYLKISLGKGLISWEQIEKLIEQFAGYWI